MISIIGVSLVSAVLYILVKRYSPEYSILVEAGAVVIVLWAAYPYLCDVIDFFGEYTGNANPDSNYLKTVIKALGTAILTQFAADICTDAGETALSSKVEFAGKLIIAAMTLPIAKALLELALKLINR